MKKLLFVALSLALVAVVALGAFSALAGRNGATGANANVTTNVNWTVRDAQGLVKAQGASHNYTARNLINAGRTRLSAATNVQAADIFANISLCSTGADTDGVAGDPITVAAANDFVANTACVLSANLAANPQLADIANVAESGNYTATKLFTAAGAVTIRELELSKNLAAGAAPATADIGAVHNVTIDLASGDTLQITWTVDID